MGIRGYLSNKIRVAISSELQRIAWDKAETRRSSLMQMAVFDPETVRIDDVAGIANNRGDRQFIKIGNNSWIRGHLMTLKHGGEITIGENSFVGENSRIWSSIKVAVGNNVLISHNVNIHDNSSHPLDSAERHQDFLHVRHIGLQDTMNIGEAAIVIADNAWIGFNATILKGVTIGEGAIVGANAVITKDVPPFAVVVGNPARIIKYTT